MTDAQRMITTELATPDAPFDVVAFGPHPDDVELFCGGLVAKLVAFGHRAAVVDLTRGELASRGTPEQRALEAASAARALGLQHRENLALPDGGLRGEDDEHVARVVEVLRRLRPSLVLAPCAIERHPDHEATHAIVRRALFLAGLAKWPRAAGAPHRTRIALWYPMRVEQRASFVVDVSEHHATKLAAVRCHASQVALDTGATLVGSPLSLSSLAARDAHVGAHIGVAFGEAYVVDEAVAIDDPVEYFRGRPSPLFFPGAGA